MCGQCPSCASPLPAQAFFCPICGIRLARAEQREVLQPGTLIGTRYRLEAPLASGSMGAVWRARDERLHGRLCAVKSVVVAGSTPEEEAELRLWFKRETTILSQLVHPSICNILDVVAAGSTHYMVMELVEGNTLAQELELHGTPGLPEDTVLGWADVLTDALRYLHTHNPPVVFRDLKPSNVMLRPDGRLTLVDFGIARFGNSSRAGSTAIGTGGYAPPEQYQGLASPQSDVYGLAATLHHLLTGWDPTTHEPFSFPAARSLAAALSPQVAAALERALSMKPAHRFGTIDEFRAALRTPTRAATTSAAPLVPQVRPAPQGALNNPAPNAELSGVSGSGPQAARAAVSATPLSLVRPVQSPAYVYLVRPPDIDAFVQACAAAMEKVLNQRSIDKTLLAPRRLSAAQTRLTLSPYLAQTYTLHAEYWAGGHLVHQEDEEGTVVLRAHDGTIASGHEARLIRLSLRQLASMEHEDRSAATEAAYCESPAMLPRHSLERQALADIVQRNTRRVRYQDPDGRRYMMDCVPRTSDVRVNETVLLRVLTAQMSVRVDGQTHLCSYAAMPITWEPYLLRTDLPEEASLYQVLSRLGSYAAQKSDVALKPDASFVKDDQPGTKGISLVHSVTWTRLAAPYNGDAARNRAQGG